MKTISIVLLAASLSITSASAQSLAMSAPADNDNHECLMVANDQTWSSLGLNADQIRRVKDIQAACKKDMGAKTTDGAMDQDKGEMRSNYDAQIKSVLTSEQYEKWKTWCKDHPMKSDNDNKMKSDTKR